MTGRAPSAFAEVQVGSFSRTTQTMPETTSPIWDRQVHQNSTNSIVNPCCSRWRSLFSSLFRPLIVRLDHHTRTAPHFPKRVAPVTPSFDQVFFRQMRIQAPDSTTMAVMLYDRSGSASAPMGTARIPVGGNLGEGLMTLKVVGADGEFASKLCLTWRHVPASSYCK